MTDSREVAHFEGGPEGREVAHTPGSGGILAGVLRAATDPNVDAEKVRSMVELGLKLQDRELRAEFNRDKIAAIQAMPAIYKRGKSDKHRYAKFEDLHRAVMPILAHHNLTIDFRVGSDGNMITVQPVLRHNNGQVEEGGVMKGPPDQGPGRSAVQAVGSTTSYLKRHSMKAMLNLIEDGEDDDGAGGRPDDKPNDRQARLILDAQDAADRGEYDGWYGRQSVKDKAWLVSTGIHARVGGGRALPAPVSGNDAEEAHVEEIAREETSEEKSRDNPAPAAEEPKVDQAPANSSPQKRAQQTPEEWTEAYCARVKSLTNVDRLDEYVDSKRDLLTRLESSHPKLHEKAVNAHRERREAIVEGRLV